MAGKNTKAKVRELLGGVERIEATSAEDKRATNEEEREELQKVKARQDESDAKIGKTETRVGALEFIFGIVSVVMVGVTLSADANSRMVLKENRELREQVYHLQVKDELKTRDIQDLRQNDELQKREIQDLHDKLDGGEG